MSYRCPGCGTVYEGDQLHCGQNLPFECRETLIEVDDNAAVIAALRLADVGAPNGWEFQKVARVLLAEAPPTELADVEGPRLLIEAIRAGRLQAVVTGGPALAASFPTTTEDRDGD